MVTSPLRTHNITEADFVFVPFPWHLQTTGEVDCKATLEQAIPSLPMLKVLPHLAVLHHPLKALQSCYDCPEMQYFTFINHDPFWRGAAQFAPILVTAPLISHVHWHMGSVQYQKKDMHKEILANKTHLLWASFHVRTESRQIGHDICVAAGSDCRFFDYNEADQTGSALLTHLGYKSSLFTIMPKGEVDLEFVLRSAFYEAVTATSIPVIFDEDYAAYLPFRDIVAYKHVIELVNRTDTTSLVNDLRVQAASRDHMSARLQYIYSVRHVFQYALNPAHELVTFRNRAKLQRLDDAFTFTLKSVLRTWCEQSYVHSLLKC